MADISLTGYLVLGVLSVNDASAYELVEQFSKGIGEVWRRADRNLYDVPKRLTQRGLLTARQETSVGRRKRTVYSITPAGREALKAWIGTDIQPAAMEFEGLVRLLFADQGGVDELRATLATVAEQARERRDLFISHAEYILATAGGSQPERAHVFAFANRYMIDHFSLMSDWAEWVLGSIRDWPDTVTALVSDRERTRRIFRDNALPASARPVEPLPVAALRTEATTPEGELRQALLRAASAHIPLVSAHLMIADAIPPDSMRRSARLAHRAEAFAHQWCALLESPGMDPACVVELIDAETTLSSSDGRRISGVEDICAWFAATATAVAQAAHSITAFHAEERDPGRVHVTLEFAWQGLAEAGQAMRARTRHEWTLQEGPGRLPVLRRFRVEILEPFAPASVEQVLASLRSVWAS
ncbi:MULTISPECIES: PadR family transcriptional regulator [Arthrobacter]|uniref:PadR family transcriptional regulator n=2 Tax=Arthrobacter TaxID=1663 RepID=A0ABU9KFP0_9MICC|nr:PadR family transcriptional regulator [Arthrobacter sp. YJM1]MDP5225700.1 PadR family transcriptional regulator [Arthrobacter sp. YJM1]